MYVQHSEKVVKFNEYENICKKIRNVNKNVLLGRVRAIIVAVQKE